MESRRLIRVDCWFGFLDSFLFSRLVGDEDASEGGVIIIWSLHFPIHILAVQSFFSSPYVCV